MGKTSDDSKRCRWPDCDCYSPIGPHTCRKAAPVTPMTDKAPDLIERLGKTPCCTACSEYPGWPVEALLDEAATALAAANARIAMLEDKLELERALSDGAHRRARNARAEALEEAAAKADDWTLTAEEVANGTGWPANVGEHIGDAIRALKGGSNG